MDERGRTWSSLLAIVWLPLAVVLFLPAILLLGLTYYVRALAVAVAGLIASLLGLKSKPAVVSIQPPHFFESKVDAKKSTS